MGRKPQLLKLIKGMGKQYSWPLFISWVILALILLGSFSCSLISRGSKVSYEVPATAQEASFPNGSKKEI